MAANSRKRAPLRALTIAAILLGLASCAHRLGWGVVLWSVPEAGIEAGAVVPVYIRSNIEKLYVVGKPGGKEKLELPLWQVEVFKSRRAAEARVREFGELLTSYLLATRDGLPVREKPNNTARRVYRLRENQSVKALAKVEGEAVTTGGEILAGEWYQVLADDGTRGYVFSNTMRLYDERVERPQATAAAASSTGRVDLLFSRSWRPEYFQEMIDDGRVDLDLFSQRFGLFSDAIRRQIRIELPAASKVFTYTSIEEEAGAFLFVGSPLRVRFEGENRLSATWSEKPEAPATPPAAPAKTATTAPAEAESEAVVDHAKAGRSEEAVFIVLGMDIREATRAEETRRQQLLDAFLDGGEDWTLTGPLAAPAVEADGSPAPTPTAAPASAAASRLVLSRSRRFSWTSIASVPSEYLPEDLGAVQDGTAGGEATIRLELPLELAGSWDGALSLRFDGARRWSDYLYRRIDGVLELLPAQAAPGLSVGEASGLEPLSFKR